jgi:oxaloacetate decarboxylase alpha subunit
MKIKIVETSLRDGQQSLIATRMTTEEILSVIDFMDQAGFYSLEVWGGATFDSCLRFLNEDPWERLRLIKSRIKKTKLQMLLRGQNLVGYRHYSNEVVDLFIKKSIENGIDILRIFDALNDFNNIESSIRAVKKYGGHCQVAMSYTTSPFHDINYFVNFALKAESMGADSICIKDMAGLLLPHTAYELVKEIKSRVKIPLNLHSHDTSGIISSTYVKAIEAGVDIIDSALSPFSGGTSQPSTEGLISLLTDMSIPFNVSLEKLHPAIHKLEKIRDKYISSGLIQISTYFNTPKIFQSQVPGGMYSNLISQLSEQKILHRLDDILLEIPLVRKDLGYPPLVTPISQIVGVQATLNVITNERYKVLTKELISYCKGNYGEPPSEIEKSLLIRINTYEDNNKKVDKKNDVIDLVRSKYSKQNFSEEVILSLILFEDVAEKFYLSQWVNMPLILNDFNFLANQNFFKFKYDNHVRSYEGQFDIHSPFDGIIKNIVIKKKEFVRINEILVLICIDNINIEILSPSSGIVEEVYISINEKVLNGKPLLSIKKI